MQNNNNFKEIFFITKHNLSSAFLEEDDHLYSFTCQLNADFHPQGKEERKGFVCIYKSNDGISVVHLNFSFSSLTYPATPFSQSFPLSL